jgi:hypothetical protein
MSQFQYNREFIVHHLQNNSPSKFMYSFGKAPRFLKLKKDNKVDRFYNLPSTLTKRATVMGFGNKTHFNLKNSISEFISIKRDFDKGFQPGFKYSFGVSRDKFSKVYYPGIQLVDFDIPGPGKYNVRRGPGLNSPKYTMRPKCLRKILDSANSPGPGNYSTVVHINSEGKYPLSGIQNIKSITFGKNKANRFVYKNNDVPGPGMYKLKSLLGINYISKYNSGKLISIHKKLLNRKNILDMTPGPGSYSSFSEFGTPRWETHKTLRNDRIKKIKRKILSANTNDIINKTKI